MTEHKHPPSIDIKSAAQSGAHLEGVDLLSNFERLAQLSQVQSSGIVLHWSVHLQQRAAPEGPSSVWLHLQVNTTVGQTCQRCLMPVDVAVRIDREFRFVDSEALAEQQDENCDEDLLVLSRAFDLAGLIEDEVLMDLPVVPRHDVCPVFVKLAAADADFDTATEKPNPFAALVTLKTSNSDK